MNADAMAFLARKGLSLDEAIELARILEAAPKPKSKAAIRQARYRARKEAENVTSDVTSDVTPPLNEYISKPPPSETKVSSGRERSAREQIVIPDWIPETAWAGWIEMRRLKHAKPSPHAIRLAIGELEKLRRDGHDPGAVLDQSTLKNWTGLFPIKEKSNGKRPDNDGLGRTGRAMLAVENQLRQAGHH